ncbi:MAG TPA: C4-type zinc ribbon domain-containing protein [Dongiaceae bacterium]|nr:C4-type zinc ribbon domain-containing protein [Dongiaceae bacterium]
MHPAIPLLLQLQKTDMEAASLRAELEAAPKHIRELDAKLTGARNAVAAAKEAQAKVLAARKKAELDVAEWRERAKKFRAQTSAVKTNEAYKALQHEIANADAEIAKAEDAQLEQMLAVEEAEKSVKAADAALRESEQSLSAERKEFEARAWEKRRKMDADIAARGKIAAQIPEEIVALYSRAAKRHHGVALAEALHEQCRGCGMRILPHIYQEVHRPENQEIYHCENCGRILYAAEPAPPAGANPSAASAS